MDISKGFSGPVKGIQPSTADGWRLFVEDEIRLVKQAQAGEKAAFVALNQQNQPSVYTYIYYRVGNQMTVEDLTAEMFVSLVNKIHRFKTDTSLWSMIGLSILDEPIISQPSPITEHSIAARCTDRQYALPLVFEQFRTLWIHRNAISSCPNQF